MTCSSPTHHALISIGADTYCAVCFTKGYEFAMERARVGTSSDAEAFYKATGLKPGDGN